MKSQGQACHLASMEETHFWKQLFKSQFQAPAPALLSLHHRSWEEKAFAEDTAGQLGGSVWPPRSYSCNFCMREFRSAQALGGHMNVHRRDRARLQQSLVSSHIENLHDENDPNRSLMVTKNNIVRVSLMNQLSQSSEVEKKKEKEKKKEAGEREGLSLVSGNEEGGFSFVETDLSMNSFGSQFQNRSSPSGLFCGNDQVMILSSKRPKISISSSGESISCDTNSGSTEEKLELDLELRLGDPPKFIKL